MSAQETPLAAVKRLYGSKDKLVDAVAASLKDDDNDETELKQRLQGAPNKKLLRLAEVAKLIGDEYGGKGKLAETIASRLGKDKDGDFIAKLKSYSAPRLLDMAKASNRSSKKAGGR